MTDKQISTYLNGAVKSNMLGENTVPLAEDMSNYIEFGTSISSLAVSMLEDFKQNIAVQIRNDVIERVLARKDFKMFKDSIVYGGALQRIMSAGTIATQDSHLLNLQSGTDYMDGKYYGANIDAKIYTSIDSFKVCYSISDDDWRLAFSDAAEMRKVISLIYNAEQTTITAYLNALVKRIYIAMIENCSTNNREVKLLTIFNDETGGNPTTGSDYTLAEIFGDRKLLAYFSDFVKRVIAELKVYTSELNKRYNDGTVEQFIPMSDIETVMISKFFNQIRFGGNPIDYSAPELNISEISCWQSTNDAMLPTLNDVCLIKLDSGDIDNVVGIIYDSVGACGIENVADKVTSQYIGSEGFTNYYHHMSNRYYVDTRFGSVILTLN